MRSPALSWQVASIVLVMLAVVLQWYSHSAHLLVTADSCDYLSASLSFKTSYTLINADGTKYVHWPPMFPIVLSLFGDSWYWMQLLITAWIGILVVIQTRKVIEDPLLQFVCQVSILLGVHLLLIGTFLWSELLFLLILFHFSLALEKKQFAAALALGFLLCLQRNAGLFFVTAASLCYAKDLRKSIILFVGATSGFWAWNIYASVLEQDYFTSSISNFGVISMAMMRSFAPLPGIVFVLLLIGVGWLLKNEIKTRPVVRLWCFFIITYLVGLTLIFKIDDGDRFSAVVIPFFTILLFRAFEIAASKQTSVIRNLLIVVVICWLAYPLSRAIKNALQWHEVSAISSCNNYE